jgi:hypothetical protein
MDSGDNGSKGARVLSHAAGLVPHPLAGALPVVPVFSPSYPPRSEKTQPFRDFRDPGGSVKKKTDDSAR